MVPLVRPGSERSLSDAQLVFEDAWLSDVLGHRAVRLAPVPEAVAAAWSDGDDRLLATTTVPTADVAALGELTAAGLAVVDCAVTLELAGPPPPAPAGVAVTVAAPERADEIADLAASELRTSRFHLDPRIADADADRVKRAWARNCATGGRGIEVLAADVDGRLAGFLAVLADGDARVIDLVAVDAGHRRRGVGRALVAAFAQRHGGSGPLRVGTQASNVASLRFYSALGFRPVDTRYVLHGHREAS